MRRVLAFLLGCLFSFWTWKDGLIRWVKALSFRSAKVESTNGGRLALAEGQEESEFARFLTSLPEDDRWCSYVRLQNGGVNGGVRLHFGPDEKMFCYEGGLGNDMGAGYSEFLASVASSKTVYGKRVTISVIENALDIEHMVGIVDALQQSGNDFQELRLFFLPGSIIRQAKCVSSVLGGCDGVKYLDITFQGSSIEVLGKEEVVEIMANVATPNTLRILKWLTMYAPLLDGDGMEEVMKPFMSPYNVLEYLRLYSERSDVGLEYISAMLATSTSLKSLDLKLVNGQHACTRGYNSLAAALRNNESLEALTFRVFGSEELKSLMDSLMPQPNNSQYNTTLTKLVLTGKIGEQEGVETLVEMLQKNTSLLHLSLDNLKDLDSNDPQALEYVLAILEALKSNKSLKTIGFPVCEAVGGSKVLGSMMDLLLENHCIEDIDLHGTPLEDSGDAEYVHFALSKRKKMRLWDVVRGMANVRPTSGRVFLCGEPYAGKTQLQISMTQLPELQVKHKSGKKGRTWLPNLCKHSARSSVTKEEVALQRTRGIEVASLAYDGVGITVWDMAGQTDYHSFHELVMPNLSADGSCSLFMLLCNPTNHSSPSSKHSPSKIKDEIESWLRLIASNTRRSLLYRPHVCIVMTHFDHWKDDDAFGERIEDVVMELRSQFEEFLEFDEDKVVFKVDGRTEPHARSVFDFMRCHLKRLLKRLPLTISACEEVQKCIANWNAGRLGLPLLEWDDFCKHMCEGVEGLEDSDMELAERRKEFVATSLNDAGHIIYNEDGGIVITNPHWFCHNIMGEFLHQCAIKGHDLEIVSSNGMISTKHMKRLILSLVKGQGDMEKSFDDILGVMKKLHVCYNQDANCIMIPSMLKDKHHNLLWCKRGETTSFVYVGRRLACKDKKKTMLSAGFFARLQVSFFKKLQSPNDQDTYELYQNIIQFISDGFEVIIEFNHGDIDILLRSCHSQDAMLKFLDHQIVKHIKHLQEDSILGCFGVLLEEYVLRPACVEMLTSFEHRKDQYACMKDFEAEVLRSGFDAVHNWKSCEGLGIGFDEVKLLLGGLAWTNFLEQRAFNLKKYEKRLYSLGAIGPSDMKSNGERHDASFTSIFGKLQDLAFAPVFVKLDELSSKGDERHKEIILKLDDLKEMIDNLEKSIKSVEGNLLQKICAKIDNLMAISKEMQESQIPKLAYLCKVGKRKLLTRWVSGLVEFHLHLMCESMEGFHEIANQSGYVVRFGTEQTKVVIAMLEWGLKIATMLVKVGAHVACGMGEMIPDWSNGSHLVALVLDTPSLLDGRVSISGVESLPYGMFEHSRIAVDMGSEAQRWLMDVLEPKCKSRREFHEMFELTKVRYNHEGGSIVWICDACRKKQSWGIEVL